MYAGLAGIFRVIVKGVAVKYGNFAVSPYFFYLFLYLSNSNLLNTNDCSRGLKSKELSW